MTKKKFHSSGVFDSDGSGADKTIGKTRKIETGGGGSGDDAGFSIRTSPYGRDHMAEAAAPEPEPAPAPQPDSFRPKTRIVGHGGASAAGTAPEMDADMMPVTGWLVVVKGPGRGRSVELFNGMNTLGRGEENSVRIDFGDTTISREAHAYVTYDDEGRMFFISHGGKQNLVRRNNRPVLNSEELADGDTIRIGETTLRFRAFCSEDFDWSDA